jgi:glutamyl/glutaminyl-tRNA synthetase
MSQLTDIPDTQWTKEHLEKTLLDWIKASNKKNGDYLWPLRVALTGLKNSPGPFETAWALGKKDAIIRIEKAIT